MEQVDNDVPGNGPKTSENKLPQNQVKDPSQKTVTQNTPTEPKNSDNGTCPLCRKTQLAKGCGHKCGFCFSLFCSRCGGKAQVKNNFKTNV